MIHVAVEEPIPESQQDTNAGLSTIGAICGFAVMMFFDVILR